MFLDKIKNKEDIDIIQNYFGYETAFDTFINKKADDTLHWLYSSLSEIVKYYIGRVKDDNINILTKEIEIIIKENYNIYNRNEEQIQKEIIYIDEILRRIKYAKENVDIIYSIGYKEQDKKLRTMIKSSLTRAEKLMKIWRKSFINNNFELVLETRRNIYIILDMYSTVKEIKMNMLAWKSRPCIKGDDDKYLDDFREKFNKYFEKNWTEEQIGLIYQRFGNGVNPKLCEKFVDSNYDFSLLEVLNEGN